VRARLLDHVRWLVHAGADGLRVDTVKHVPVAFWRDYQAAAGVFTIGEVLDGAVDKVAPYSHVLSATLDYPLYFAIRDVFGKGGSARALGRVFAQDGAYRDVQLSGVFIDNHDQPRFLCEAGVDRLRLALAFAYTVRGIPIVYYGTEQELASCSDNRQDMFDAAGATPLTRYLATLAKIRASHEALRVGTQYERWQDDTAYAFERVAGASVAVVAFNLSREARTLTLRHLHVAPGTVLRDALGSGTVTAGDELAVTVPAMSVAILTN
jgi:alpha-amylase